MRHTSATAWVGAAIALTAAGAPAQSLNIRFGTVATTPASTYAAAGLPGAWNSFLVTPGYVRQPLVGLQGTAVAAEFYQYGNASMLAHDNPLTSGDDGRLMDSMILSTNSPVDGCFWVQGLTLGDYEVTIYAMTPNDPSLQTRTRVDDGSPGPTMVGGTWPGLHQPGVTYARFTVTTTTGVIGLHGGLYGGVLQSGVNGIQFRFLPPCSSCYANCDCSAATPTLNVADFSCFLTRFASGDAYANCDSSTATPTLNVADFTCFLQKFATGCR